MTTPQPAPHRYPGPQQPHPGQHHRGPAPAARTSPLSVVALVAAFLAPIIGLVLGVVARRQIARSGEDGKGLATTAIVLGTLFSLAWIVTIVAVISVGSFTSSFSTTPSVPASSVQSQIQTRAGLPDGSVTCPDPLPATIGATTTCTASTNGQPTPIIATVTSVDGTDVGFDFTSR